MHKDIPATTKQKRGKRKFSSTLKSFARFLKKKKKYRGLIILSIILAIGSAMLSIFIPKILGDMTNIAVDTYPNIDFGIIIGKCDLHAQIKTLALHILGRVESYSFTDGGNVTAAF